MHVKPIKMRWLTGGVNYSYLLSTEDRRNSWLIDPAEPLEVSPKLSAEEKKVLMLLSIHITIMTIRGEPSAL